MRAKRDVNGNFETRIRLNWRDHRRRRSCVPRQPTDTVGGPRSPLRASSTRKSENTAAEQGIPGRWQWRLRARYLAITIRTVVQVGESRRCTEIKIRATEQYESGTATSFFLLLAVTPSGIQKLKVLKSLNSLFYYSGVSIARKLCG